MSFFDFLLGTGLSSEEDFLMGTVLLLEEDFLLGMSLSPEKVLLLGTVLPVEEDFLEEQVPYSKKEEPKKIYGESADKLYSSIDFSTNTNNEIEI